MNDRKLIELAAKAAGIVGRWTEGHQTYGNLHVEGLDIGHPIWWNPLTDDGEALRLAAVLRLKVIPGKHKGDGCTVEAQRDGIAGCTAFRDDPAEQMRYAIVHVAAEIGKAML